MWTQISTPVVQMGQKNVTLSFNEKIYADYKEYCRKKGIVLSRNLEIFMEETMRKEGFKNGP